MLDPHDVITSTTNEGVKYVRALQRRRERENERSFAVEGVRTVEEGIRAGHKPALLFHTLEVLDQPRAQAVVQQARQATCTVRAVSEQVMASMADTVSPSGILAVFPICSLPIPDPLEWVLVADGLRDPGNMGTILRSAWAARVQLVVTTANTVDVYSPKVVRAAMGAHFRLSLLVDQPWNQIEEQVRGLRLLLAQPRLGTNYWEVDWRPPTVLLIGGEAQGASADAERLASGLVNIPMDQATESLNAAVATSILLFEAARQRYYAGHH